MSYLHADHLGSTSLVTNASGGVVAETRYTPYGEERWSEGVLPTDRTFTGQRSEDFGLLDYNARYYDPALGRFISADTLVPGPGSPLAWDRYAYVQNNPIRYIDPTGHRPSCSNVDECRVEWEAFILYRGSLDRQAGLFGVSFSGQWSEEDKQAVVNAVFSVGIGFSDIKPNYAFTAFKEVYPSGQMEFVNYACPEGCWGRAISSSTIRFYNPATNRLDPILVIPELGHSFNARVTNVIGQTLSPY